MIKVRYAQEINDKIFNELTDLVNEWDPIGLIRMGAPRDEYSNVVVLLFALLPKAINSDDVLEFIYDFIPQHFGVTYPPTQEPYKARALERDLDFSNKVLKWYRFDHFKNNISRFSKFVFELELETSIESELEIEVISIDSEVIIEGILLQVVARILDGTCRVIGTDMEYWYVIKGQGDALEILQVLDDLSDIEMGH